MAAIETLLRRLRALFRKSQLEREMDEELRNHLELEREELARNGLGEEEARRRALVSFGGVSRTKEEAREARGFPGLEELAQDVRHAVRSLRRNPGLALVAVLVVGLAVGANTAVLTIMERFVLDPLPGVPETNRLVTVTIRAPGGGEWGTISYPNYRAWRDGSRAFESIAVQDAIQLSMRADGPAQRVWGVFASWNLFQVLHVRPILGRVFERRDVREAATTAVISHGAWRRFFAGDPGVVGRHMMLNGRDFTVIGVLPRGFVGTDVGLAYDLWVPVSLHDLLTPNSGALGNWGWGWLHAIARLKPGVSIEQARQDINAVHRPLAESVPANRNTTVLLRRFADQGLAAMFRPVTAALLGVTILVLLAACANLANLLLARAMARRREIGIRLALGVGRGRLVAELVTESLLLSLGGGALGILLALWARGVVRAFIPAAPVPFAFEIPLDARILGLALAATLLTGLTFGLIPAFQSSREDLLHALRGGAATGSARHSRLQGTLVAAQVALAVVSLVCAGLFVRGLQRAQSVDTGMADPERVLLVGTDLFLAGHTSSSAGLPVLDRLLAEVRGLPGVRAASVATYLPLGFGGGEANNSLDIEGYEFRSDEENSTKTSAVGADYFETVGTPVTRGRGIGAEDRPASSPVAVVNEAFVRRYWPGRDALGRQVRFFGDSTWRSVVGVVHDARYQSLDEAADPMIFFPIQQWYVSGSTLHVRTAGDPRLLQQALRRTFERVDPNLPFADVRTLAEHTGAATFTLKLGASMLAAFGLLALALAVVGLYGVLSYSVAQRTREMAVRIALGALPRVVLALVVGRAMRLTAVGLAVGVLLAAGAGRLLRSHIFGVSPLDPVTFGGVAALLAAVALVAAWIPARRAAVVDPLVALQAE